MTAAAIGERQMLPRQTKMTRMCRDGLLPQRRAKGCVIASRAENVAMLAVLIAGMFGAFVGSFLNVCVHRLPRNESVVQPPSRCYGCGARVRWYDNLPLISYLILRGRCRWCQSPYSVRYVIVEALIAALTAAVVAGVMYGFLPMARWPVALPLPDVLPWLLASASLLALVWFLLVATLIDLEHLIIPDELTKSFQFAAPFLALACATQLGFGWSVEPWLLTRSVFGELRVDVQGFLVTMALIVVPVLVMLVLSLPLARWIYSSFCPEHERWREADHQGFRAGVLWFTGVSVVHAGVLAGLALAAPTSPICRELTVLFGTALLGSLAGWCSLYVVGLLGTMAFRKNAMGFGDVKFLAPVGAWLGPVGVVLAFFGAAVVGSAIGLPFYLLGGRRHIPFGPYLALGAVLALLLGPTLARWFMAGFGH